MPPKSMTSKPIRILLSEAASAHLTAAGESCFAVIGRQSHPGDVSRWILHLIPCDIATADSAVAVAKGTKRSIEISKAKKLSQA
jgi:hypothetical protein